MSGQAALVCQDDYLHSVAEAELGQDAADMGPYGRLAQEQFCADLGVRQTAGNGAEDIELPFGQRCQRRRSSVAGRWPAYVGLHEAAGHGRREEHLTAVHSSYCGGQVTW